MCKLNKYVEKSLTIYVVKNMKKILTPYFEMHIIETKKAIKEYKNNEKDEMLQWIMFLEDPEGMEAKRIMEKNENIKKAKEELDDISKDRLLRRMALKAEMERMDNEQRMYEAKRDGISEGEHRNKIEVAKKMIEEKLEIEMIAKVTGLTKEEILKLK